MGNEDYQAKVLNYLAQISQEITDVKSRASNIATKMKHKVSDKIRALYDSREVQVNINDKIITTLERIEAKVDVLQMETSHVRRIK